MYLKSENIALRAVEPSDVDLLYEWENDTSVWRVSNTIAPYSRYQIEEYVLNSRIDIFSAKQLRLMIDLKEGDSVVTVGSIDLFEYDPLNRRAGIGILIRGEYRNKGYASEALEVLLGYVRETLKLHQVWCNISEDNHQSIRLFEKTGFARCGIKEEWLDSPEGWKSEYMYQMILDSFTDRA